MQNTIAQHHQRRERVSWNHQFHCAGKPNRNRMQSDTTPATVAQASQLFSFFSATEAPFTRKNAMFRANPDIQIASMIHENEAFVRGILQIPRVEDMKTKLSCEASFKFQQLKIWKRSFRARLLSHSASWRCENEACVRGFLQIPRVEDVKTKLACEASFKFQDFEKWTHLFNTKCPNRCKTQ